MGIKAHALKIAEQGYRVLVPDLYKGKLCLDVEEAHHNMDNLDFPGAVAEIAQAAAFLKKEGSAKVGICGFCMGGALTMGGLAKSADIVCGAPFYGVNFGLFECTQLAQKPVQGHFGAEDTMAGFSDAATGKKLAAELQAASNAEAEVFIYERVGRSWAFPRTTPARLTSPGHDCLVSSLSILSSRSFVEFGPGRVCGRNRPWKEETVAAQLLVGEALKYRTTKQTLDSPLGTRRI